MRFGFILRANFIPIFAEFWERLRWLLAKGSWQNTRRDGQTCRKLHQDLGVCDWVRVHVQKSEAEKQAHWEKMLRLPTLPDLKELFLREREELGA